EFRLARRRVDVREQRRALAEQRTAGAVVGGADVAVRDVEVGAVEDVEQLRDQLDALAAEDEGLRQAQSDVGKSRAIDLGDGSETARGPRRVDRIEIQIPAAAAGQHA